MSLPAYNNINDILHKCYGALALESTSNAAEETTNLLSRNSHPPDEIRDCQVSVDGTWQKRGHASMNGVVTVISKENGKCLDVEVLSKKCRGCTMWKSKENMPGYHDWKANHICQANHIGSSGAMEGVGTVKTFARSMEKNNLRYIDYVGDGDTTSFKEVLESKPYGDTPIQKLECVGHVQKRLGTRCRTLRQTLKGKNLSDEKGISGRGRLTDKAINTLQNYYGMAIRQNINDLYKMKKSVCAVLHHNCEISDENVRHQFCPRDANSWCLWQADIK